MIDQLLQLQIWQGWDSVAGVWVIGLLVGILFQLNDERKRKENGSNEMMRWIEDNGIGPEWEE